ncbi:MAG TPA: reverse transcriptase family protein [Terriglobales bacterium]|nr:reverse transcriptase family protein [Terriglobales bacterium]
MKIICSERDLAWKLGVPLERLRKIADNPAANYREFSRWKNANKTQARMIRNPREELKAIQRLIKDRVFGEDAFGPEVHGGISRRSAKSNAERHLGARVLATIDVKGFFDNVDHRAVFRTLREFGFSTGVACLLTKLTTRKGLLPQGAPTSVAIANLVLARPVDAPTRAQADEANTTFTRFIDDIGLSGDDPATHIRDVARRLSLRGLSIHRGEKLKIRPRSMPQTITGLNINSGRLTVPRQYHEKVRAAIHGLRNVSDPAKHAQAVRKLSGRIAYIHQYQPAAARRLARQLANHVLARRR